MYVEICTQLEAGGGCLAENREWVEAGLFVVPTMSYADVAALSTAVLLVFCTAWGFRLLVRQFFRS